MKNTNEKKKDKKKFIKKNTDWSIKNENLNLGSLPEKKVLIWMSSLSEKRTKKKNEKKYIYKKLLKNRKEPKKKKRGRF